MQGLIGGVIGSRESSEDAAARHLKSKIELSDVYVEQLYTFSDPERDKRSRSISIAYIALISPEQFSENQNSEGKWVPVKKLPTLAYDHAHIAKVALERLRAKLIYTNIIARLLPKEFTLPELQNAYEIVLDSQLDKRNFRKKMLSIHLIKKLDKKKKTTHRPAQLYSFVKKDIVIFDEMKIGR